MVMVKHRFITMLPSLLCNGIHLKQVAIRAEIFQGRACTKSLRQHHRHVESTCGTTKSPTQQREVLYTVEENAVAGHSLVHPDGHFVSVLSQVRPEDIGPICGNLFLVPDLQCARRARHVLHGPYFIVLWYKSNFLQ